MNGVIAWFARNSVAANLLLIMILLAGFLAMPNVQREMFPQVSLDVIKVSVPYPGATPVEVEEGLVVRIEEAIAELEGIDTIQGVAAEGMGTVVVEVLAGYDTRELLSDVKTQVDAINTFPENAEEPVVEELSARVQVISIVLSAEEADETILHRMAEEVRDDLLAVEGITQVKLGSVRPYEIGIHVSEKSLRRHGLTFDQVAAAVRHSSLDLPAGAIRSGSGDILLRTKGQAYRGHEFEQLVLLTREDGTRLHLSDVATVVDGFDENEQWARFDGRPAAMLSVLSSGDQNVTDVARAVEDYVAQAKTEFPEGVRLDTWFDFSRYYRERQDLMLRNGATGLILVLLCLSLFMHMRLAFWVAVGLIVSFVGTFAVMWAADVSFNMISLAAFILVLGIVVDDAIVVSESIHRRQSEGANPETGAIEGVSRVASPVIFAVLTSVIAFMPMLFISGVDGKFWRVIPIVIIPCLLFSLVESLLVLPAHLSHARYWFLLPIWPLIWVLDRAQTHVDRGLKWFIHRVYRPVLEFALAWRYLTVAVFVGVLILTLGLVIGGRVPAAFFPRMPGDFATAWLEMPDGTSAQTTAEVLKQIEAAAFELQKELDSDPQKPPLFRHVLVALGSQPIYDAQRSMEGGIRPGGTHLAEVAIEFQNLEKRGISSQDVAERWRDRVGTLPGVRKLTFTGQAGHNEDDIDLRLTGENLEDVEAAASELKNLLAGFAGVYEISDTLGSRKQEITLAIKPRAEALGLRAGDLARQVRQAFYGEEAQRIQRGRDDIRVMVRYPPEERRSVGDLENLRIRTAAGDEVPLSEVADVVHGTGVAQIRRSDRRRVVDVTAMLDRAVVNNPEGIMSKLNAGFLAQLPQRYPGLTWAREGRMKDKERVVRDLVTGLVIALFGMYALMAVAFRSYLQPVLIGVAIPFGFVGAVVGHLLTGLSLSMVSLLGLIALAGVVVNDGLVLIDAINRLSRQPGMRIREAVERGTRLRFRAIVLTSLTTFLGLTPLMLETSVQAQFIIPMAVALAFGVAFSTLITLTLIPALYLMLEDAKDAVGRLTPASSGPSDGMASAVSVKTGRTELQPADDGKTPASTSSGRYTGPV